MTLNPREREDMIQEICWINGVTVPEDFADLTDEEVIQQFEDLTTDEEVLGQKKREELAEQQATEAARKARAMIRNTNGFTECEPRVQPNGWADANQKETNPMSDTLPNPAFDLIRYILETNKFDHIQETLCLEFADENDSFEDERIARLYGMAHEGMQELRALEEVMPEIMRPTCYSDGAPVMTHTAPGRIHINFPSGKRLAEI